MTFLQTYCPYCDKEKEIEIEGNCCDGDMEEVLCECGKSYDVEISFSVHGISYKKEEEEISQNKTSTEEKK